jgi:hypothetical protein
VLSARVEKQAACRWPFLFNREMQMSEQLKVTSPEEIAEKTREVLEAEIQDPGELVTLPKTGIVVRLRRTDTQGDALTGGLPLSLVAAAMEEKADEEEMTPDLIREASRGMIFMRQTVVENCLEPRIGFDMAGRVAFLTASGQSIARVHKEDFRFMFAFITGQEARIALNKFRNRKTRRAAAASTGRKKLRVSA